ncbi:hypothetical protein JHK82_053143 [Glycine max]|nr:hypothetical protein JHK86_052991 [Glycine max]KAG5085746.1 hypothetical protein JHK82_053143 [Glycine max]
MEEEETHKKTTSSLSSDNNNNKHCLIKPFFSSLIYIFFVYLYLDSVSWVGLFFRAREHRLL